MFRSDMARTCQVRLRFLKQGAYGGPEESQRLIVVFAPSFVGRTALRQEVS